MEQKYALSAYKPTHITPQLIKTAYHEAGHALACVWRRSLVQRVTAMPQPGSRGHCLYSISNATSPLDRVKMSLAGAIAARIATQPQWYPVPGWRPSAEEGAGADMQDVFQFLREHTSGSCVSWSDRSAGFSEKEDAILDGLIAEVFKWLSAPARRQALDVVASLLMDQGTLVMPLVNQIIRDSMTFPSHQGFVFAPDFSYRHWKRMVELGGVYDPRRRAWWIPPSQINSLNNLRRRQG